MPNSIVELVEKEMERFRTFRQENPSIFQHQDNLYPIPFFGDIRNAEVLTLALNPAWTEFDRERHWIRGLDARALTTRLLHYFDLPEPAPHDWFAYRGGGLALLNCSYQKNAAHIDLHSFPTKFKRDLSLEQCRRIGGMIKTDCKFRLLELLELAPKAKLVLVVDYLFLSLNGDSTTTFDFLQSQESELADLISESGARPPIFRAGGPDEFEPRVRQHADVLREHLNNSLRLRLCPFAPLR